MFEPTGERKGPVEKEPTLTTVCLGCGAKGVVGLDEYLFEPSRPKFGKELWCCQCLTNLVVLSQAVDAPEKVALLKGGRP